MKVVREESVIFNLSSQDRVISRDEKERKVEKCSCGCVKFEVSFRPSFWRFSLCVAI